MNDLAIVRTPSACDVPLSIGADPRARPSHCATTGDRLRRSYAAIRMPRSASACSASRRRSRRWASGRARPSPMMDWDSHRYLECFFAVPMMGAVLHTVNMRISPEQVLYTINHAKDDVILVNAEFLPLLEAIHAKIRPGRAARADQRGARAARRRSRSPPNTSRCSSRVARRSRSRELDEDTRATTFYTTGTTGLPKGVYYSHRQLVLHTLAVTHGARERAARDVHRARRLHADHADVPRARVGISVRRDDAGRQAGLSGTLRARRAARADRARRRHVLALRADDPADDAGQARPQRRRSLRAGK